VFGFSAVVGDRSAATGDLAPAVVEIGAICLSSRNRTSIELLFGVIFLTGSPGLRASPLPCSNMDISDPVGGIGSESTASVAVLMLVALTLGFLRGVVGAGGCGLALRLAASVAAMKLGLLFPT
jgi:hypothetical protein